MAGFKPQRPNGMRLPQRAGRLAGPDQLRCVGIERGAQTPGLRSLRVVPIAVRRQAHPALPGGVPRHPGGDAKNELTGTTRQQHAAHIDPVEISQSLFQVGVTGIRVTGGVGVLHGRQRLGAGAAGVAVGGKIKARHAQSVGPAMLAGRGC